MCDCASENDKANGMLTTANPHYEQIFNSSIEPRARLLHRLYRTLR